MSGSLGGEMRGVVAGPLGCCVIFAWLVAQTSRHGGGSGLFAANPFSSSKSRTFPYYALRCAIMPGQGSPFPILSSGISNAAVKTTGTKFAPQDHAGYFNHKPVSPPELKRKPETGELRS
jgi:hypothetical protein